MLRILLGGCGIKDDRRITIHFTSNEKLQVDYSLNTKPFY